MDGADENDREYVFKPELHVNDLVWGFIIVLVGGLFVYQIRSEIGLNYNTILATVVTVVWLFNFVRYFANHFSIVKINRRGFTQTSALEYFSFRIQWSELSSALSSYDEPYGSVLFLPKKKLRLKYQSFAGGREKWRQICIDNEDEKCTPKEAISEFFELDDFDDVRIGRLPIDYALGRIENRIPMYFVLISCSFLAYYLFSRAHSFSILSHGIPWFIICCAIGAIVVTIFYLVVTDTRLQETYLSKFIIGLPVLAFLISLLVKSVVIFSGNDSSLEFTLEVKDGGYQLWRSPGIHGLVFSKGWRDDEVKTKAEQGETKMFKVKSAYNIHLLYPDQIF